MRILIADDSPVSLTFLKKILESWGHEPITFNNGTDALNALISPNAPHIAILDWSMPGLEGIDVCRKVRSKNIGCYILMLTAKDAKEDILTATEAGADDYICKPFVKEELHLRLRSGIRITNLSRKLKDSGIEFDVEEGIQHIIESLSPNS